MAFPTEDSPLEPAAAERLPQVAARLGWRAQALAAPSRAAHDTAVALAADVVPEPALRDCDYGAWAGLTLAEIEASQPEALALWLGDPEAAPHGGESLRMVIDRLRVWLDRRAAPSGSCLAVTAPFVARALTVAALDLPVPIFWRLDAAPLTISRYTAQHGRWRLAAFGAPA